MQYETEEQQVEAIKNWWKENGTAVIFGAVVGLGGLWGWRYYNDAKIEAQEVASAAYTKAMDELAAKGLDAASDTQAFIDANKDNNYAALAAMMLAKSAVEAGEFKQAEQQLKWIKQNKASDVLLATVNLRLARVQSQLTEYDAAIATLAEIKAEAFQAKASEVKGDIYMLQGNAEQARTAYQAAVAAGGAVNNPALQIKLDDLATPASADEALNG